MLHIFIGIVTDKKTGEVMHEHFSESADKEFYSTFCDECRLQGEFATWKDFTTAIDKDEIFSSEYDHICYSKNISCTDLINLLKS